MWSIGIHDAERRERQRLLVSITVVVERAKELDSALADVFDYDVLRDHVLHLAGAGHVELQEHACAEIARFCQELPQVTGGWVRTAKPDVYPDAEAIGCQQVWGNEASRALLALAPA
jgi:dihydroneopterin aldolase